MPMMTPVSRIKPGMRLAKTIYDSQGRVLLAGGVTIRQEYIDALKSRGYGVIYVTGGELEGVEPDIVVSRRARSQAYHAMREFAASLDSEQDKAASPALSVIDQAVGNIVGEVMPLPSGLWASWTSGV